MIGVVYGGNSLEHDVSVMSANAFFKEIEAVKFFLDKKGNWFRNGEKISDVISSLKDCDVIFPLFHGEYGENGTFQGFLEFNHIPYVGCGVDSSVLCMDKDLTKRILESHGIKTAPYKTYHSLQEALDDVIETPCIIKTTSLGSTFGVYKVLDDPKSALIEAFKLGDKVLKEELIEGREIWCSLLEDGDQLICSRPCELIPNAEMHTYETKYTDLGAKYHVPVEDVDTQKFQELGKKVFRALGCRGMARVDFFLRDNGEILVNEVNTIPGFTPNSLYPKALIADGISYKKIVEILVRDTMKKYNPEINLEGLLFRLC